MSFLTSHFSFPGRQTLNTSNTTPETDRVSTHHRTSIETKNGNEVSRDGDPEDPAVVLDTGKSKAIKSAHELN